MQTILHKNDLSNGIDFSNIVAADCETMGLQPNRDPLCLIQLFDGKGDCHLVQFLDQNFHSMLSLPFFLFLMTSLAVILTMYTNKKSDDYKIIIFGLISSVIIYYIKDLSVALGKTDRIPLVLSIWAPILALSFFTFIGVLQINEK